MSTKINQLKQESGVKGGAFGGFLFLFPIIDVFIVIFWGKNLIWWILSLIIVTELIILYYFWHKSNIIVNDELVTETAIFDDISTFQSSLHTQPIYDEDFLAVHKTDFDVNNMLLGEYDIFWLLEEKGSFHSRAYYTEEKASQICRFADMFLRNRGENEYPFQIEYYMRSGILANVDLVDNHLYPEDLKTMFYKIKEMN